MYTLYEGDCIEVMRGLPENSVDAIVTDPPYEMGFMGKKWDSTGIAYSVAMWREVLRVLKPGGHLLSFGGTRTYHRMTCAIEDAGFEVRDQLQWLYGSGFPKSMELGKQIDKAAGAEREVTGQRTTHDVRGNALMDRKGSVTLNITAPATPEAQQWNGWGTCLKPANEPICLARKPLSEPTIAANVLKWGTGGLNVDGCRIPTSDKLSGGSASGSFKCAEGWDRPWMHRVDDVARHAETSRGNVAKAENLGRFPANILLDEAAAAMLDEQSGVTRSTGGNASLGAFRNGDVYGKGQDIREKRDPGFGDFGGASRFFYVAKASKSERGEGNSHSTVKPIKLMRYLIRLVTPPNGIILDPFAGSGTTMLAAEQEGFNSIGIEISPEYCEIIRKRLKDSLKDNSQDSPNPNCL